MEGKACRGGGEREGASEEPRIPAEVLLLRPGSCTKYCDQCVRLSVCALAYLINHAQNLTTFSVHVARGRGSVLI